MMSNGFPVFLDGVRKKLRDMRKYEQDKQDNGTKRNITEETSQIT